ncbi:MAG: glucokinase [Pseudomonadota bacterium]|nr:glucokinase [Pseudomonadota bacterium]
MILAGDVGATKILLEVGEERSGRWRPHLERRYLIGDFPNMAAVLATFLAEWNAVRPARARIAAGAVGVAGPAQGNRVKMTHRPWTVDGDALARRFKIPRIVVVNDLFATASGIDLLGPKDYLTLQPGKPVPGEPRVILGLGTGLGVAYEIGVRDLFLPRGKRSLTPFSRILPGEGGHMGFSPASEAQERVWRALMAERGRVEGEDVASGRGIANIYRALTGRDGETAWITTQAIEHRDPECVLTLDVFSECLGNIAGDHALAVMARGGILLAGGAIARIAPSINKSRFRAAFAAKGLMSSLLTRIPVRAITQEKLALLGASRIAIRAV